MKKIIKIIGNILAIISIAFVIYTIYKMDIDISSIPNPRGVVIALLGAVLISVTAVYLLAIAWTRTVSHFAQGGLNKREGINVYVRANIGKYLPGNVMHYVERNVFLVGSGLEQFEIALSSFTEIVGQLLAAIFIGVLLSWKSLFSVLQKLISTEILIVVIAVMAILILVAVILIRKVQYLHNVFIKMCNIEFVKLFFTNLLIYIAVVALLGSALALICYPLHGGNIEIENILMIISTYTVAWIAGFVVLGAPGGVGVREFVLGYLTASSPLANTILLAAVLHRIATIIGDVCSYFIEAKRKEKACNH